MQSEPLACVILAHADPVQLNRLIAALDPFPIFLHIDSRTPPEIFDQMVAHLPGRVTMLPRIATGWARWENVEAELVGYRRAIAETGATHIALLTGSDYPLVPSSAIASELTSRSRTSVLSVNPLPYAGWGQGQGFSRLRYRHWVFRKHMIRLPIRRKLPRDVVFAGGPQCKVLARHHAQAVIHAYDANPVLAEFWRRTWIPDETFVHSMLATPRMVPDWKTHHVQEDYWWIGWGGERTKSPPWLTLPDMSRIFDDQPPRQRITPLIFARKFSTERNADLLESIDRRRLEK